MKLRNVSADDPANATYTVKHHVLVMACGPLSQPQMPEGVKLDVYQGTQFHSQQWRHDVALGRRSSYFYRKTLTDIYSYIQRIKRLQSSAMAVRLLNSCL